MMRKAMWGAAALVAVVASGRAEAQSWSAVMNGSQEVPANGSTASGFTFLSLSGNLLNVNVSWTGITGGPLAAGHIHCCTVGSAAGQNVGVAIPYVGLPSTTVGSYNATFDLLSTTIYTAAFLTASGGTALGARDALIAGLNSGRAYSNLHNGLYPGGEIRGNLVVTPEPGTYALLAGGLTLLGGVAARRRRSA